MRAINALDPAHVIEDAVLVTVRYGDDTPGYYAIDRSEIEPMRAAAEAQGGVFEVVESAPAGAWIGIQVAKVSGIAVLGASAGGVAAWGRARIETD